MTPQYFPRQATNIMSFTAKPIIFNKNLKSDLRYTKSLRLNGSFNQKRLNYSQQATDIIAGAHKQKA